MAAKSPQKPVKNLQKPAKSCKIRACPSYQKHPVRRKKPPDASARAGGLPKIAPKYPPKLAKKSYPQSPSGPVAKNRGVVMPRQQGGGELRRSSFGNQPMQWLSCAQNISLYGRTRPTSGRSYRFAASSRSSMACSVARRDDRHGHESLLSVDPVSFTVTVSAKEAFLFHLLISPPLPCVPGTPPELPGTPRNSLPGTPLANVLSVTPWQGRPAFIEGTDRPLPLVYLLAGGETAAKLDRARR